MKCASYLHPTKVTQHSTGDAQCGKRPPATLRQREGAAQRSRPVVARACLKMSRQEHTPPSLTHPMWAGSAERAHC